MSVPSFELINFLIDEMFLPRIVFELRLGDKPSAEGTLNMGKLSGSSFASSWPRSPTSFDELLFRL